ncbi:MAG TPA: hypothetical protein VNT02_12855 [Burkholderiales bacterium]|nr:hypothetical protein [Burkholderiales bacterium]
MASTLNGGGGKDRNVTRGHGTGALGPSDTSDSGSDIQGGPGLVEGDVIGLDEAGTTSDQDLGGRNAGPDIGDAELDSDSDSTGTGERRAAGRDPDERADADRDTDRVQGSPAPQAPTDETGSGDATGKASGTAGSRKV